MCPDLTLGRPLVLPKVQVEVIIAIRLTQGDTQGPRRGRSEGGGRTSQGHFGRWRITRLYLWRGGRGGGFLTLIREVGRQGVNLLGVVVGIVWVSSIGGGSGCGGAVRDSGGRTIRSKWTILEKGGSGGVGCMRGELIDSRIVSGISSDCWTVRGESGNKIGPGEVSAGPGTSVSCAGQFTSEGVAACAIAREGRRTAEGGRVCGRRERSRRNLWRSC